MKIWPKIQVHDRWHAMTVAQCWPTHVLALVGDRSDAMMSPRREVVRHIEVFADITDPDDQLLVHCAAGIGRSPAGALAVWCALGREPTAAVASLLRIHPEHGQVGDKEPFTDRQILAARPLPTDSVRRLRRS